jgi:phage baseplate assembly protein W
MTVESEEDIQRRYFGKGPLLQAIAPGEIGMDIVLGDGTKRDVVMQAGGDNLGQDIKIALLTGTGTDVFNLAFGFDGLRILTSDMTPAMTAEMLRLSVMKTVALDSRVKRVLDVTISEADPDTRRYTVTAEVQTVLGDVLNMTLGEVNTR